MVAQARRGYAARQQQGTDLDRFAGGSMSDHGVTLLIVLGVIIVIAVLVAL